MDWGREFQREGARRSESREGIITPPPPPPPRKQGAKWRLWWVFRIRGVPEISVYSWNRTASPHIYSHMLSPLRYGPHILGYLVWPPMWARADPLPSPWSQEGSK